MHKVVKNYFLQKIEYKVIKYIPYQERFPMRLNKLAGPKNKKIPIQQCIHCFMNSKSDVVTHVNTHNEEVRRLNCHVETPYMS